MPAIESHFRANVSEATSDFARETRFALACISSIGVSESQFWTKVLGTEPKFVQKLGTEPNFGVNHETHEAHEKVEHEQTEATEKGAVHPYRG